MNKNNLARQIIFNPREKETLAKDLGCSLPMINRSFSYFKDTALARAIRNEAIRRGAISYVLVPEEVAWFENEGKIENYLTGDTIDKPRSK